MKIKPFLQLSGLLLAALLLPATPTLAAESAPLQEPTSALDAVPPQKVTATQEVTPQDDTAPVPKFSSTVRASLKTVMFQAAANLSDTAIFGALMGATATTSVAFLLANTASAMVAYFPYELAWDAFGPPPEAMTADAIVTKTVGYQIITGARNLALSYAFTGEALHSMMFVATVVTVDAGIYLANEYLWDIISPRASSTPHKIEDSVTQQTAHTQ